MQRAPSPSCFLPSSLWLPYWTVNLGDQGHVFHHSIPGVWFSAWEIMATQ